jgi:hypothetical protein
LLGRFGFGMSVASIDAAQSKFAGKRTPLPRPTKAINSEPPASACTPLRKLTLSYMRLNSRCTAHCCIIVHSL